MPTYQLGVRLSEPSTLTESISNNTFSMPPGVYWIYTHSAGDGATPCDVAHYIQISPDRGVTWFDWFVDQITQRLDTTTGGATTTAKARNLWKITTQSPSEASGNHLVYHAVLNWPGGRIRGYFKVTTSPGGSAKTYLVPVELTSIIDNQYSSTPLVT